MEKVFWSFIFLAAAFASISGEDVICSDGVEFIPHENCSLFYQCSNGNPYVIPCPEDFYWNPRFDTCDYPQNVPECQGGTRPPTNTNPTTPRPISTTEGWITNSANPDVPSTSPIPDTQCGQIINATSGQISYKLNRPYDDLERCAWTIHVPGASRFKFVLEEENFEDNYDGVIVTGLSRWQDSDIRSPTIKLNNTKVEYEIEGSTAIVLFYSDGSITGTGFRLSFSVTVNLQPLPSNNDIIFTEHEETVDFIPGAYQNNELSTILHVAPLPANLTGIYSGFLENNCINDYFLVMKLRYGVFPHTTWDRAFRLCHNFGNSQLVDHTDATLYVFKSDGSNVSNGFKFEFSSSPYDNSTYSTTSASMLKKY